MDYVGMMSLGLFLGTIAAIGLRFMNDAATWKQGMAAMITATLSGSAVIFVDRFGKSAAVGAYPLGLFIGLIWGYAPVAIEYLGSPLRLKRVLGFLHLVSLVVVTFLAGLLIFPYAWAAAKAAWRASQ